jgi:hypothetical protein
MDPPSSHFHPHRAKMDAATDAEIANLARMRLLGLMNRCNDQQDRRDRPNC